MKTKFTKIIVLALALVMIFGTFASSAYESYDTYTYSIDGKPLESPHAYTPDVVTYNSKIMQLLNGNYWHYDSTGDIVVWPQRETNSGIEFSTKISYVLNSERGYTAVSYATGEISKAVEIIFAVDALANEYRKNYPKTAGAVELNITSSDIVNADGSYVHIDELVSAFSSCVDKKIADAEAAGSKVAVASVDIPSIRQLVYELMDLSVPNVEIPAEHNLVPVTAIAGGLFAVPAINVPQDAADDVKAKAKIAETVYSEVYSQIRSVFIGKNVTSIGENAFAKTSLLSEVYYDGASVEDWANVAVEKTGNDALIKATVYSYSASEKFGNKELNGASDIVTDHEGNIYIADKNNNRIVILNYRDLKIKGVISNYIDENNKDRTLNAPSGIYVTNPNLMVDGSQQIFVCNTGDKNIVVFDSDYNYVKTIKQPPIAGMLDEGEFDPTAIAVDKYGRIFIVSRSCYKGIIVMSNEGVFTGFIGAQKVTTDFFDQIWKSFQSMEDKQSSVLQLPDPFNNLTVDDDGFVYATINFTDEADKTEQLNNIQTKEAAYSPVKKLNSMGIEIMKRNGFFDPGGEVVNQLSAVKQPVSKIIDISIGDEGTWTILDAERQRTFTYDQNGNLLFAFGNSGNQLGNTVNSIAIAYQPVYNPDETEYEDYKYNLIVLDKSEMGEYLTVYHPTDYCDMIMKAIHNENSHKYDSTISYWQDVLTRNNNFDLAYIGIGKALYNLGEYEEAMEMLKSAYETEYYAKAFAEVRKDIIAKWMLPLIIGVIALLLLFFKLLGFAKKRNKATALKVGKKTYGEEMLYVFHLIFHPFDGFWDLKHEKRGSVRAGTTILGITIFAFFYQAIGTGYIHSPRGDYSTVFIQVVSVLIPVILWVIGNWCLTTLFDGEGSFKDIYVATCYSLAPLPLFVILSTVLSNVLTLSEGSILTLLVSIGYVWVGILLFFGMTVTHDYTTGKNVITTIGTIVAMVIIMFIVMLFSSLVMKMVTFIIALVTEIFNRIV